MKKPTTPESMAGPHAEYDTTSKNLPVTLEELIDYCKQHGIGRYAKWVRTIANNPGIKTHELIDYGLPSNNPHQVSSWINDTIKAAGWEIVKTPHHTPRKSWRWYLVRASK